jgi:hypothetical protein
MIRPTVGRVVWYRPNGREELNVLDPAQPLAAIVAFVHGDKMVNLSVIDHVGQRHAVERVVLLQEGDNPSAGHYCEWMPYQKGQAARTEQLEQQRGGGGGS